MLTKLNQVGSHVIVIALAVIAIGVIGFTGYRVTNHKPPQTISATSATIQTKADLSSASQSLDSDGATANSTLEANDLSSDLDSLL